MPISAEATSNEILECSRHSRKYVFCQIAGFGAAVGFFLAGDGAMCPLCTGKLSTAIAADAQGGLTALCALCTYSVMQLEEFMSSEGLDDESMAALVRKAGAPCDRSTISRLRRGKVWLSRQMAIALRKATGDRVTANDFAVAPFANRKKRA